MRWPLCAAAFLAASVAVGQQPRISSVFPAGGKASTTAEVTALGTELDDATGLLFSHPGLSAEIVPPEPPKKDAPKPAKKIDAKFKVNVAAAVPPGAYDVRVVTTAGVSNPRLFVVGDRPEGNEKEPNNDTTEAQKVGLNSVVNGTIGSATDVDYTSFAAKAGQRVLVHCAAGGIDSKLKPLVEVFAPDGRRLAAARNYQGTDALADVTVPADGEYLVRLTEFAHQAGGPDYFYRLTITTGPWIDAVFPPAVEPGKATPVTLFGRNLPTTTAAVTPGPFAFRRRIDPPAGLQDSFEFRLPGSNAVPIYLAAGPVTLEQGDNDRPETAQLVPVPGEVAGRIEKRYDRDWYQFAAKKGDVRMIELFADRLGSAMDGYLTVRDAATKQDLAGEASLDDDPDPLHPTSFFSRNADPVPFRFVAPADGTYLVLVGGRDANVSYGPRSFYRLRIGPPRPDVRAVVMPRNREQPATATLRPDGDVAFDVFIQRLDGFNGPVTATVENLPAGVTASPAIVGTGQRWGTLVLAAAGPLADGQFPITVKVSATINGQAVTREARPASITWGVPPGQNTPTVARLDQQLILATRGERASFRLVATPPALVAKPGEKLTVPVKVLWQDKEPRANPVNVFQEAAQPNMNQAAVSVNGGQPTPVVIAKDKADAAVVLDVRANAAPGSYAVTLRGETAGKPGKDNKPATAMAFAAPFAVKVVPTTLGKLTVQTPAPLKQGGTAEITVRVERLFEFDGLFAVAVQLPKEAAGLTIPPVTIPAGASEAKLVVTAAKDAKPGGLTVPLTAVATWDGKYETKHETKFNLTVVK